MRLAGAYHRAYALARRGEPRAALKIIDEIAPESAEVAADPAFHLRLQRIRCRLCCWDHDVHGSRGRDGLLALHRELATCMTELDWRTDTTLASLMADLLQDLAAVGAHDTAFVDAERLLMADVSGARLAHRKTVFAKLLESRAVEHEFAGRSDAAASDFEQARRHAAEAHSANLQFGRAVHAMDSEKQFIRARLGLARVRAESYSRGTSHAATLLRSTIDDSRVRSDEQFERVVLLAHAHDASAARAADGTALRRAAYYYVATWNHALSRYLDPLQATGIVRALRSVGQAARAERCREQGLRKLALQFDAGHSAISALQSVGAPA